MSGNETATGKQPVKHFMSNWHLDPRVSAGNLLTLGAVIVAGLIGFVEVKTLAQSNGDRIEEIRKKDVKRDDVLVDLTVTAGEVGQKVRALEGDVQELKAEQRLLRQEQQRGFERVLDALEKKRQ